MKIQEIKILKTIEDVNFTSVSLESEMGEWIVILPLPTWIDLSEAMYHGFDDLGECLSFLELWEWDQIEDLSEAGEVEAKKFLSKDTNQYKYDLGFVVLDGILLNKAEK